MTEQASGATREPPGRLEGLSAIVTGAAQGIGRGIAERFAREGARVTVADINAATGEIAARQIAADVGGEIKFVRTDVTRDADTRALAAEVTAHFDGVDILCHNAGIYPQSSIEEMTEGEWDHVLATNLKSALLLVKACLPSMKTRGRGRIVFTSSITGPVTALPNLTHYGASKAGLLGFVRGAAVELAPFEITVNAVLPGNVMTPGVAALGEAYHDAQIRRIPLRRLATPADIAGAMVYFASPEAAYVTGQYLIVDGGQTLPES
jgi:3-oxoacyl-[acyl-carrier protein] reductase